jgi:O-antigen/teichoic acid export membrane protein
VCLPLVAGAQGWHLILPLAVGAASYVVVATLGGSLAGVAHWRSVALLVVTDGLLRLALTGLVVLLTHDVVALAWAAALPFPLAIALLWPVVRRRFVGTSDIDVGYRALTWNVLRTVLASLSTAILVSGFPLVLGVVWAGSDPKLLGQLIFAITLARAPLIVAVMSFQGVLIVRFRDGARPLRTLGVLLGSVAAATAAAAVFAWFLGEPVFELVAGPDFGIDRGFLTVLVISSGLIGALCVTGAATLAAGAHRWFTGGWLAAAAATIVFVVTGSNLLLATATAVLAGPLAGLVVHLVHLLAVAPKRKAPNVG